MIISAVKGTPRATTTPLNAQNQLHPKSAQARKRVIAAIRQLYSTVGQFQPDTKETHRETGLIRASVRHYFCHGERTPGTSS